MSKQHFVALDGMRGVAALSVVALHASQVFAWTIRPEHAFLAVDFFFCLSGFVVGYAYDARLARGMTVLEFCKVRLIRLYPLIGLGVLMGGIVIISGSRHHLPILFLLTGGAFFLLPIGLAIGLQAFPTLNPLWSLFFELCANLVYALRARSKRARSANLGAPLLISAIGVALVAVQNRTLEPVGFKGVPDFLEGTVRVSFPFIAGLFIYRSGLFLRAPRPPAWILALALGAALFCPWFQESWIYDCLFVIIFTPLIVAAGAASPTGAFIWRWAGRLSYPLYIVHLPVLQAWQRIAAHLHLGSPVLGGVSGLIIAIGAAFVALRLYDEPLRRRLSELKRRPNEPATPLGPPV